MQEILNVLTLNNVDYTQHGDFGSTYYIIKISNTCQIKLEYLFDEQERRYNNAFSVNRVSSEKELDQINKIVNLIKPFLKQEKIIMTIKEFCKLGGKITPKFQLVDQCEDTFTKDDVEYMDDDTTSEDLIQISFDHERYAENEEYDKKHEYFTVVAPDGTVLGDNVTKDISDQIVDNYETK